MTSPTSTGTLGAPAGRVKLRNCVKMSTQRCVSFSMSCNSSAAVSGLPSILRIATCAKPRMPVITLRTSWVTPAATCPRAARVSFRSLPSLDMPLLQQMCAPRGRRQRQRERAALPDDAVGADAPMMLLDDAMHQRQPEPLTAPVVLGREEGIEDLGQHLGRDA